MNFAFTVKSKLQMEILKLEQHLPFFVKNPGHDFIRNRKLSFQKTIQFLLATEGRSNKKELLEFFHFSKDTPTASALCQQKAKLLPEAIETLFHHFNQAFSDTASFHGNRLIACDGTMLNIATDPQDLENHFFNGEKGCNQLHLDTLYNLCSKRYEDAVIQPGKKHSECRALANMVDRYETDVRTIFLCDRGYECYNVFAHIEKKGMFYLVRAKDKNSNRIVSRLTVPETEEFDIQVHLELTRKMTNKVKAERDRYRVISSKHPFDFLDKEHPFYPITFRVVRFAIGPKEKETYECIITNLPQKEFPASKIKELYNMRWGIETSYRELKYAADVAKLHAKKVEYIKQEIFAGLLLYNFSSIITAHVIIDQKNRKHKVQPNYTIAIHICRYMFRCPAEGPPLDVEYLIGQNLLPIRKHRKYPRKIRAQRAASFTYR